MPEWRNGRRDGLKIRCPQGRVGSTPTSGTTGSNVLARMATRTLGPVSTTFSGRLIERRLLRGSQTLRQLREELRVVDEQLAVLSNESQDKELRSLVSETPSAAFEHRDAQAHVESISRHRAHLLKEILDLELRQDSLLDRLGR